MHRNIETITLHIRTLSARYHNNKFPSGIGVSLDAHSRPPNLVEGTPNHMLAGSLSCKLSSFPLCLSGLHLHWEPRHHRASCHPPRISTVSVEVFSRAKASSLPPHYPDDCAIELLAGSTPCTTVSTAYLPKSHRWYRNMSKEPSNRYTSALSCHKPLPGSSLWRKKGVDKDHALTSGAWTKSQLSIAILCHWSQQT